MRSLRSSETRRRKWRGVLGQGGGPESLMGTELPFGRTEVFPGSGGWSLSSVNRVLRKDRDDQSQAVPLTRVPKTGNKYVTSKYLQISKVCFLS